MKQNNYKGKVFKFNNGITLKVKATIGEGSFSNILSTNNPMYIIKIMNATDPNAQKVFKKESRAYQTLSGHPNIVTCFD